MEMFNKLSSLSSMLYLLLWAVLLLFKVIPYEPFQLAFALISTVCIISNKIDELKK